MNAAIGLRVHSGWAVLVVVSGDPTFDNVVERSQVTIIDTNARGAKQPYHFAAELSIAEAERHIADCAITSHQLAMKALGDIVARLRSKDLALIAAAVIGNAVRPLPPLPTILGAHPLIHKAEGEFFRAAFRSALDRLGVPVTTIRDRDLGDLARAAFGKTAAKITTSIHDAGRTLGPPWTQDHKSAALAAAIVLAQRGSRLTHAAALAQ